MAKTLAVIFGIILVLLGLLGFVSNPLIGANALFVADTAHNLIHVVLGVLLLGVGIWSAGDAARWLKVVGAVTLLLGLIGIVTVPQAGGTLLGIAQTNGASDWLHVVAGVVMVVAGLYGKDAASPGMPVAVAPTEPTPS